MVNKKKKKVRKQTVKPNYQKLLEGYINKMEEKRNGK